MSAELAVAEEITESNDQRQVNINIIETAERNDKNDQPETTIERDTLNYSEDAHYPEPVDYLIYLINNLREQHENEMNTVRNSYDRLRGRLNETAITISIYCIITGVLTLIFNSMYSDEIAALREKQNILLMETQQTLKVIEFEIRNRDLMFTSSQYDPDVLMYALNYSRV